MTDTTANRPHDIERRIAAAHAARTQVDSQGRPLTEATTFKYDENGQLIETVLPPSVT